MQGHPSTRSEPLHLPHRPAEQPLQLSYPPLELRDSARADYILVCLQPAFAHALIPAQANGKLLLLSPASTIETEGLFLDVFHQDRAGAWRELRGPQHAFNDRC